MRPGAKGVLGAGVCISGGQMSIKITKRLLETVSEKGTDCARVVEGYISQKQQIRFLLEKLENEERVTRDQHVEIERLNQKIKGGMHSK